MRKFLGGAAMIFAEIFTILFIIAAVPALLMSSLGWHLFSSQFYKNVLTREGIYNRLPDMFGEILTSSVSFNPCPGGLITCEEVSPQLKACFEQTLGEQRYTFLSTSNDQPSMTEQQEIQRCVELNGAPDQVVMLDISGSQQGMPQFLKNLSVTDWSAIFSSVLPPSDLQKIMNDLLNQSFDYLNGRTDSVTLPLVPVIEHLTGTTGAEVIRVTLLSQPACTPAEIRSIKLGLASDDGIYCNPSDEEMLNGMIPGFQERLSSTLQGIPDEAVIFQATGANSRAPGSGRFGEDLVTTLRSIRLIMQLSLLVPLLFLLVVTLLGVRSLQSWLRLWGVPLFFAGLFTLATSLVIMPGFDRIWSTYIVTQFPAQIPTIIPDSVYELVRAFVVSLARPIMIESILLTFLGLAAWISSIFLVGQPAGNTSTSSLPTPATGA